MTVSLKALGADQPRCEELAILPAGVDIPLATLGILWGATAGLTKVKVEKLCMRLDNLSLLQRFDLVTGMVRLHDVIRKYLEGRLADRRAVHAKLIDAWGDPRHLPDEYAWRWYGWHCLEAADTDRLRKLLLTPAWIKAKLEHTEVGALVADCQRLVREQQTARRELEVIGPKAAWSAGPDPTIRLLGDALRNSAHVLARAPSQLCDQLFGRLRPGMSPELDKLCDQLLRDPGRQKLRARFANLEPAGSPRLRTLAGHENSVLGALLLPDGKRALSWSFDKTLRLWDLEMGNQLGEPFIGHQSAVDGALLLPTGKRVLSWSLDETLRLWDLETGKQTGDPLTGHKHTANGALLLPGGKRALSWSLDETLRLWDLETGKQVGKPLIGHESCVTGALLLPCGRQAISWSLDKTVRLWDLETTKQTGEPLARHEDFVNGALLLPDGKR